MPAYLTEKNVLELAKNIFHEARGEPVIGQYAVAGVTIGRAKDNVKSFGGAKLENVIYAPKQFSWTIKKGARNSKPWLYKNSIDRANWDKIVEVAVNSIKGTVPYEAKEVLDAIEHECLRYYKRTDNRGTSRRGRSGFNGLAPVMKIGVHTFYTDPKTKCYV